MQTSDVEKADLTLSIHFVSAARQLLSRMISFVSDLVLI